MHSTNELKKIDYPTLGPEFSGGWLHSLRLLGPGAIVATVTVGTGETVFAPRAGALFGYALLWVVALITLSKAVLVYTGARHIVLTGEHPMQAWTRLPGPRAWVPKLLGLISVLAFPLWIAALSDAVGSLCVWITGVGGVAPWGRPLWGTGIILTAMALSLVQTYNIVERVSSIILIFKVILIFLAVSIVKPDWISALWGMIVPSLPEHKDWVAASYPTDAARSAFLEVTVLMGAVGGGVQDYIGYIGFLREKRWGASSIEDGGPHRLDRARDVVARGIAWLRAPLIDTSISFGTVFIITTCFMILGAAVLHPLHLVPTNSDLYSKQSQFLAVIHPQLVHLYKAGILFAIFGVIYGTFELYTRTAYEPLKAIWPKLDWKIDKLRLWIVIYSGVGGLTLLWTGLKTVTLATIVGPFSGVLGCGLWCIAMLWVDRSQMPQEYRMSKKLFYLALVIGLLLFTVGCYITYIQIASNFR